VGAALFYSLSFLAGFLPLLVLGFLFFPWIPFFCPEKTLEATGGPRSTFLSPFKGLNAWFFEKRVWVLSLSIPSWRTNYPVYPPSYLYHLQMSVRNRLSPFIRSISWAVLLSGASPIPHPRNSPRFAPSFSLLLKFPPPGEFDRYLHIPLTHANQKANMPDYWPELSSEAPPFPGLPFFFSDECPNFFPLPLSWNLPLDNVKLNDPYSLSLAF